MIILFQYFQLQSKILKRHLKDFGFNPIFGCLIILLGFYGLSIYLFSKTEYAGYFYVLIALSFVFNYSEINRNDFLKFTFSKEKYFEIRILENLITIIPFLLYLFFKLELYPILLLVSLSILSILLNTNKQFTIAIPTPFYKKPFEFIVGFRKCVLLFFFAYFFTVMSVVYRNFNLGIFSLILVFLVCFSFYTDPEKEIYVWVYKLKASAFLFDKIKTALFFSTLICLPITLALIFFFKNYIPTVLAFQILGYCYITTIILAKYSTYPDKMNLPQGMLLALSITMPPILLGLIPYFYFQSTKRLKKILE